VQDKKESVCLYGNKKGKKRCCEVTQKAEWEQKEREERGTVLTNRTSRRRNGARFDYLEGGGREEKAGLLPLLE